MRTNPRHLSRGRGQSMKRTGKKNDQTKALRKASQKPAESKGLQSATECSAAAPKTRQGNAIQVFANKTREQFCDELCCEVEKAAGVPVEVADRMVQQMATGMVWPKPK